MARNARAKKKKSDVRAKYTLSHKQMKKAEIEIGKKYIDETLLTLLGALVDDFDFTEDDIVKLAESYRKINRFRSEYGFKLKHIAEVIEERTGMKFTAYRS